MLVVDFSIYFTPGRSNLDLFCQGWGGERSNLIRDNPNLAGLEAVQLDLTNLNSLKL
jgi:hypothetical protein